MFRGHEMYKHAGVWFFTDTAAPVAATWQDRSCGHCNRMNTPGGYDGCIGYLPGVMNACCGHGELGAAYIQFFDGSIVRGLKAIERMNHDNDLVAL